MVLIAAKELRFAKTRLAPVLSEGERAALAEAMFRDVLAAALASRSADHVAVVSSEARLLGLAREAGASAIEEGYPRGLNAAVALGTEVLAGAGADAVCTVLSDIPLVTGADIDAVLSALLEERGVVVVPSHDLAGTNIIARMPPAVIPTRFGWLSFVRHLDECRRSGVRAQVVRLARAALDLDLPGDLTEFGRLPGLTHTHGRLTHLATAARKPHSSV